MAAVLVPVAIMKNIREWNSLFKVVYRAATNLENLEKSENLTVVNGQGKVDVIKNNDFS